MRHQIAGRLSAVGLVGDRLHGFVLAVNEVITNVVLHAGGHGRLVLWLRCRFGVVHGDRLRSRHPGSISARPPDVPEAFEVGGRGVWLAYQLCDEVTMATGPIGTTIGLRIDCASATA